MDRYDLLVIGRGAAGMNALKAATSDHGADVHAWQCGCGRV